MIVVTLRDVRHSAVMSCPPSKFLWADRNENGPYPAQCSMPAKASATEPLPVPEQADRGLAALVHVSSVFWPILGPLIGWAVFAKSKPYVAAHGRQALFETLILNLALFVAGLCSLIYTITRIVHFIQTNWVDFTWQEFVVRFLLGWIALALLGLVNTVVSILQAYRAWKGHWPRAARASGGTTSSDSSLGRL